MTGEACWVCGRPAAGDDHLGCLLAADLDAYLAEEAVGLHGPVGDAPEAPAERRFVEDDEDEEPPDCAYCRGSGLSPHSIRDVACPYCGGR